MLVVGVFEFVVVGVAGFGVSVDWGEVAVDVDLGRCVGDLDRVDGFLGDCVVVLFGW